MTPDKQAEIAAITKLLGVRDPHHIGERAVASKPHQQHLHVTTNDRRQIADDALDLLAVAVTDLGGDVTATVRVLLVAWARRSAVAGFYDCMADSFGLSTDQGVAFATLAVKHQAAAGRSLKQALVTHAALASTGKHDPLEAFRQRVNGAHSAQKAP